MGKHKDKSKKHKKEKKHKKKERRLSTSSNSSEEWVERVKPITPERKTSNTEHDRDEWMNLPSSFHSTSNIDRRSSREEARKLEKERNKYNPKENVRELNPYWKDGGDGLPSFKKPSDGKFEYKSYNASTSSNWRKRVNDQKNTFVETEQNSLIYTSDDKSQVECVSNKVSNKELNALAAKLVKAELMGNADLVKELKHKLDEARNAINNSTKDTEDTDILLTTTNAHGQSMPLKIKSECGESSGTKRKKQRVETHNDGQRIRYFADDDKYSLKQMFENEKYQTIDDQNKEFVRMASKVKTDLDDFFVDEIRVKTSDERTDKNDINKAISKQQLISKSLDNCNFCLQSDNMGKHLMVSMGETIYLSIPSFEPITEGHCCLVPIRHVTCATQLDENEWSEILNFRKSLCKMSSSLEQELIFFETASYLHKFPHMVLHCVPMPKEQGELAPIYFKKAIDESETEWSINKKLISLANRDVRKAVPKGLPYFSISFGMTEGFAHVIEDERIFPQNFAQEIIGGILDLHHSKWRKPQRQSFEQQSTRVQNFAKIWNNFDCTK